MTTICKNCNQLFEGQFCNNCGQNAETHDINIGFLWHDIQHGLLHFDKGIFFTIKELFTRPGYAIKEFIEGKRVKHIKPISLVLLLAGVYGLLLHFFHINVDILITNDNPQKLDVKNFSNWLQEHYAITELLYLPLFSIASYLAFRKSKYNFAEHLVLNAFLTGQKLLIGILFFPLLYIYNATDKTQIVTTLTTIIGIVCIFWAYSQFFKPQKIVKTLLLTILTYVYLFILILIIGICAGLIYSTIKA